MPSGTGSPLAGDAGVFTWGGAAFHGLAYDSQGWHDYGGLAYDSGSVIGTQAMTNGTYAFMSQEETGWVSNPSYVRAYKIQNGALTELPALVLGGGIGTGVAAVGSTVFVASGINSGGGPGYLYAYNFNGSSWTNITSYYTSEWGYVWSFDGHAVYMSPLLSGGPGVYWFDGSSLTYIGTYASPTLYSQLAGYDHYAFVPVTNGVIAYTATAGGVQQLATYTWPDGLHSSSVAADGTTGTVYLTGYNDTQTRLVTLAFNGSSFTLTSARVGGVSDYGSVAVDKNYLYIANGSGITAYPHICQTSGPIAQCADGTDNDGNGLVDMADTCGCSSTADTLEANDGVLCPLPAPTPPPAYTIICTELHRQGLMPDAWMQADQDFGHKMPAIVMNGYHAWARPVVSLMQRSHAFTMFVYAFAHPWAQEMAYLQGVEDHGSFLGILVMVVGVPFSALVGLFVTPWW
jgi:hypothetical protein